MRNETIEQIEERLEEMKKLQKENPKARIEYDTWEKCIDVISPLPKDFDPHLIINP